MSQKVVSLYGFRGGNGKTTLAVNIGYTLAKMGHKVLILDGDFHGPTIQDFMDKQWISKAGSHTLPDFLFSKKPPVRFDSTVSRILINNVSFDVSMNDPDPKKLLTVVSVGNEKVQLARSEMLRSAFIQARGDYEYVIIDSTPGFMIYTKLFLFGTDMVIHVIRDAAIEYRQAGRHTIPILRGLRKRGHVKRYMLLINEAVRPIRRGERPDEEETQGSIEEMLQNNGLENEEIFGVFLYDGRLRLPMTPVVFAADERFGDYSKQLENCVRHNLL